MRRIAVMIPTDNPDASIADAMAAAAEAGTGMLTFVAELHEREDHDEGKCLPFRLMLAATVMADLGINPKALSDPVIIASLQKNMLDYARGLREEVDLGAMLADKEILH